MGITSQSLDLECGVLSLLPFLGATGTHSAQRCHQRSLYIDISSEINKYNLVLKALLWHVHTPLSHKLGSTLCT